MTLSMYLQEAIRYNIKRYQFFALSMKYNKKSYMHHSYMTEIFNILSPVMISSASFRLMYNWTWQWRPNTLNSHSSFTDPLFNLCNFKSSFSKGSSSASIISSFSRITRDVGPTIFQDRWTEMKI